MKVHNVVSRSGDLVEEGMSVNIRGQHVMITPSTLNDILGFVGTISDPPTLSANETFRILRPNDPIGPLHFRPVEMPIPNRAFHYIYSRTMINKSKNYTHFSRNDYYLIASFLVGQRRNVGELIFTEMRRFRFSSSRNATIPYPHLVSLILKHNKIWYLEGTERVHIPRFGRTQLTHMGIAIPDDPIKATSQREGTPSRGDEAQSSARGPTPPPPPPPSFLNSSLTTYVTEAINQAVAGLKRELLGEFNHLVNKLEYQVSRLVDKANTNFDTMFQTQADLSQRISSMELYLRTNLPSASSEIPPEATPATASPTMPQTDVLFTDPETNVEVTFERPPSPLPTSTAAQPTSPHLEPEPFDPTTALVLYTPPSDLTFPQPPSDVDKTGEKDL